MRTALTLICLVAVAVAVPAQASVVAHHPDVDRLALAGGRVLLGREAGERTQTIDVVTRRRPWRRLGVVRAGRRERCAGDSGGTGVDFGFAASAQALAVSSTCAGLDEPTTTQVFGARFGRGLALLARCARAALLRPAVAVTGARVLYTADACGSSDDVLVVRDLTTGAERRFALRGAVNQVYDAAEHLQAAGPYVAYDHGSEEQPAIDVLDLRTGEQRPVPVGGTGVVTDVAVDGAGRVLLRRTHPHECGVIELYDPGAPARVLATCADDSGIGLAAGEAAFFARGRLRVAGRLLATLPSRIVAAHLVFDGTRVAYDVPECRGRRDVVEVRRDGPPAASFGRGCPFTIPRQHPRLRGTRVTVRARCPRGCFDPSMKLLSADRRRELAISTDFDPGGAIQRLSTTAAARRALRRRGRLPALLRVAVRRLDGTVRVRLRRVEVTA